MITSSGGMTTVKFCIMEEAWDGKTSGAIGFALSFLVTFF